MRLVTMMLHAVGVNDLLFWMLLHMRLFLMSCSTTSENREETEDVHLLQTFLLWTWYSR
jgi:hypothetical protein